MVQHSALQKAVDTLLHFYSLMLPVVAPLDGDTLPMVRCFLSEPLSPTSVSRDDVTGGFIRLYFSFFRMLPGELKLCTRKM